MKQQIGWILFFILMWVKPFHAQEQLPSIGDYLFEKVVWNLEGTQIAIADDLTLEIIAAQDFSIISTLTGHTDKIMSVAWSHDSSKIASASFDGTVRIWDVTTGRLEYVYRGHEERVLGVSWLPLDNLIFSVGSESENNLQLWNPDTGELVSSSWAAPNNFFEYNPAGTEIADIFSAGIWILDTETFNLQRQFRTDDIGARTEKDIDNTNWMINGDWSPDGTQIVTGSIGGRIYIWDAIKLEPLAILEANSHYSTDRWGVPHPELTWIRDVSFSQDGQAVFAVSIDGILRIWDVNNFEVIETQQLDPIRAASWDTNGTQLFLITETGDYQIVDTSIEIASR